jgi:AraC-like ligand binding domain
MHAELVAVFDADARAAGYDEILDRDWPPGAVLDEHTHPFAVRAVVTRGEMWLACRGETRHLRPGDGFALDRDEPHSERYGPEGAAYRVARRR